VFILYNIMYHHIDEQRSSGSLYHLSTIGRLHDHQYRDMDALASPMV
jgi:hypothetical protein